MKNKEEYFERARRNLLAFSLPILIIIVLDIELESKVNLFGFKGSIGHPMLTIPVAMCILYYLYHRYLAFKSFSEDVQSVKEVISGIESRNTKKYINACFKYWHEYSSIRLDLCKELNNLHKNLPTVNYNNVNCEFDVIDAKKVPRKNNTYNITVLCNLIENKSGAMVSRASHNRKMDIDIQNSIVSEIKSSVKKELINKHPYYIERTFPDIIFWICLSAMFLKYFSWLVTYFH